MPSTSMQLNELKTRRRDLSKRLALVMDAKAKLQAAARAEDAAIAAIGKLGEVEIEAVREWATAGGEGDMPQPDVAERRRLADRLVEYQAQAAAARGAFDAFEADQVALANQLREVNADIDALALDQVQREHREAVEDLRRHLVDSVKSRIAHVLGLRGAITALAQQHQGSGRGDQAMALFQRGEAISAAIPDLDFEPLQKDIIAASVAWRGRFHELTGDAPDSNVVEIGKAAA